MGVVEVIAEMILHDQENVRLDFKKQEYPLGKDSKKYELVKDIVAIANQPSNEDKYIIIGVKELNGIKQIFEIDKLTDDTNYQRLVNDNVEPSINFEYQSIHFQEKRIAYFRIYNNVQRPYLLSKDLGTNGEIPNLRMGDGFIRKGSSNHKMKRQDFESIYEDRYKFSVSNKLVDRKKDLVVSHDFKSLYYFENRRFILLDIIIENTSNESVTFDAELTIRKNHIVVTSEDQLMRESNKPRLFETPRIIPSSISVRLTEKSSVYIIETTHPRRVKIHQKEVISDLFEKHTILIYKIAQNFSADLVLRSDQFLTGPLAYHIETTRENF